MDIVTDPASLGVAEFLVLGMVAFTAAIVGGVSGFGAGLLVTPFLVPVVGIKGVVPVMSVAMMIGNFSRFWVYRDQVRPDIIRRILVPAVPGVVAGTLIYDVLPAGILAGCIGTFLLLSIPARRWMARSQVEPRPAAVLGISAAFGTITGALPGGGVVLMPLLLGLGLATGGLVGTDAVIGMAVAVVKIVMFGTLDLLALDLLIGGLLVGLCMIPGAYGAKWLIDRLHVHVHTAIIEFLVVASGVSFVWTAVRA